MKWENINKRGNERKNKIEEIENKKQAKLYIEERMKKVGEMLENYRLKEYIEFLKKEVADPSVPLSIRINDLKHLAKVRDESILKILEDLKKTTTNKLFLHEIEKTMNELKFSLGKY